jgi:hypothetical protein
VAKRAGAVVVLLAALCTLAVATTSAMEARAGPAAVARTHRLAAYYAAAWWLATGQLTPRGFAATLDPRVLRTIDVAAFVRRRAMRAPSGTRTLLVWGNAPWIYYLSGLRPATRFTSTDYLPPIPGAEADIARAVRARAAGIVVVLDWTRRRRNVVDALAAGYRPLTYLDGAAILIPRQAGPSSLGG